MIPPAADPAAELLVDDVRYHRLELPRWDQRDYRGARQVWQALHANQHRSNVYGRARIVRHVITTVATLARAEPIAPADHLTVELVWVPERANRTRDPDNLWPLLKVCADALARGPRKRAEGAPGLDLVPDDSPQYVTKHAPRITAPTRELPAGLWLLVTTRTRVIARRGPS